jgi:hypothetical protein
MITERLDRLVKFYSVHYAGLRQAMPLPGHVAKRLNSAVAQLVVRHTSSSEITS